MYVRMYCMYVHVHCMYVHMYIYNVYTYISTVHTCVQCIHIHKYCTYMCTVYIHTYIRAYMYNMQRTIGNMMRACWSYREQMKTIPQQRLSQCMHSLHHVEVCMDSGEFSQSTRLMNNTSGISTVEPR